MGKPNPEAFPITSFSFTARTPSADGTDPEREFTLKHKDLEEALQYGPTSGLPRLIKWLLGLQEKVHERVPGEDWTLTCGAGGQDLLYKVDPFLLRRSESLICNTGDICFGGTWRFRPGRSSSLWVGVQFAFQRITHLISYGRGVIPLFLGQKCVPIGMSSERHRCLDIYWTLEIPTDAQGCSSQSLREILESWPSEKPKPKLLYIVPVSFVCSCNSPASR